MASGYFCALGRRVHVCFVSCPLIQAILYCQEPEKAGAIVRWHSPRRSVGNSGSQILPKMEAVRFLLAHQCPPTLFKNLFTFPKLQMKYRALSSFCHHHHLKKTWFLLVIQHCINFLPDRKNTSLAFCEGLFFLSSQSIDSFFYSAAWNITDLWWI